MIQKKQAKKKSTTRECNEVQDVEILFSDLVIGSKCQLVDPESCIPFSKIRHLTLSGIRRLEVSFLGKSHPKEGDYSSYTSSGLTLGSDIPMVVNLTGSLKVYVHEHFKAQGLDSVCIRERIASRSTWYGIVDGLHSHAAITNIMKHHSSWKSFKWYVQILNSGFPVEKYRQLARIQNARHNPIYYVELTFYDVISNLRMEHERLKKLGYRSSGVETAEAYDGTLHKKNSTLQQIANLAIRLPRSVIHEMGLIVNQDHPDIALRSKQFNSRGATNEDEALSLGDCRVFRKFVNIGTLKGSSAFMNCKNEQVQLHCLHRAKDLSEMNEFKSVKCSELTKMVKFCSLAVIEDEKFKRFIEDETWPREMQDLRNNMLRTTLLDEELELNSVNETSIIPKLLEVYRKHFPDSSVRKEAKWILNVESTLPKTDVNSNPDEGEGIISNETDQAESEEVPLVETPPQDPNRHLIEKNIVSHNMTWQDYQTQVWTSASSRFDAVFSAPPSAPSRSFIRHERVRAVVDELDKDEVEKFVGLCKRVLKSGSYVILFIDFDSFQEWYTQFSSSGFSVMKFPYLILYDPESLRNNIISIFPQNSCEFALVARSPGSHPDGFKPDFETNFNQVATATQRRHAVMTNVQATKTFLTVPGSKVPFCTKELPILMLHELIDLFTPVDGSVIDPYAGTMTTAAACLQSGRRCTSIEKRKDCFEGALERLRLMAEPLDSIRTIPHTLPSITVSETDATHNISDTNDELDNNTNQLESMEEIDPTLEEHAQREREEVDPISETQTQNERNHSPQESDISHAMDVETTNLCSPTPSAQSTQIQSADNKSCSTVLASSTPKVPFTDSEHTSLPLGNLDLLSKAIKVAGDD